MADRDAKPVLLLARAGEARARLEAALAQAGAEVMRVVDPADADPEELKALGPGAVLVVLEPGIEEALERHDALLTDPGVLVIFDEAEVAASREGWDAARWVRHLAAKLHGHHDVLPPGAETADALHPHPVPGALPERDFDPESVDVGALAEAAHDLAAEVPRAFGGEAPDEVGASEAPVEGFDGLVSAEDMDWSSPAVTYEGALADDPAFAELLAAVDADGGGTADDDIAGGDAGAPGGDGGSVSAPAWTLDEYGDFVPTPASATDPADESADTAMSDERLSLVGDAIDDDATDGAIAGTSDDAGHTAADLSLADPAEGLTHGRFERGPAGPDPLSLGDGLSLADDDAPIAPVAPRAGAIDLDALSGRLDGLSLADPDSYGHGVLRGAVVVEAGLGGPDAVRQLLGGLGEEFARAVLVRLQLDGGRYDRLVQQMQRATPLPVELASSGAVAEPGTVYFVPPGVTVTEDRARLVFAADEGSDAIYGALPPADSVLVFLSGADPSRVDRAMDLAGAGALVLAQSPDTCYDATAVGALVGKGAVAAEPGDLAQALLDHWP